MERQPGSSSRRKIEVDHSKRAIIPSGPSRIGPSEGDAFTPWRVIRAQQIESRCWPTSGDPGEVRWDKVSDENLHRVRNSGTYTARPDD